MVKAGTWLVVCLLVAAPAAALTPEELRDLGKAMGLSLDQVDRLARKTGHIEGARYHRLEAVEIGVVEYL